MHRPWCARHSRRRRVAIDGNQIGVPLAESIVNFVKKGRKRTVALITEIDAQGIEAIAENPRHAEQPDGAAIGRDACGPQMAFNLVAQRTAAAIAVIGVEEAHGIEAIVREQAQMARQSLDLVEIEQHPEHAVAQPMRPRPHAAVGHDAGVQCGVKPHATSSRALSGMARSSAMRPDSLATRHGRRTPPSASATARPDCRPSSWNPAPK